MAAPFSNVSDKNDRAVVAYLKTTGAASNIYPGDYSGPRILPNVTIKTQEGVPIALPTQICRFPVVITCKPDAVVQPSESDLDAMRVQCSELRAAVMDAFQFKDIAELITDAGRSIAVSDSTPEGDQRAADNADMTDYTCDSFMNDGTGTLEPDSESNAWVSHDLFQAVSYGEQV